MTDRDHAEPLPGLEALTPRQANEATHLEAAVRRSIAALESAGLVAEVDSARLALALEMADIIGIKKRSGRMSTVGNDARVLVELLDKLLPAATEVDEQLKAAVAAWNAVEQGAPVDAPKVEAPPP